MDSDNGLFIAYASIIGMALWPIWIGAHRSLKYHGLRLKSNSVTFRQDSEKKPDEVMNHKDAYMFPIYGSGTLFGLYVLIKIFSKEWVNLLLTVYFVGLGIFAVGSTVAPWVGPILPRTFRKRKFDWSLTLPFAGRMFYFLLSLRFPSDLLHS
jgi:minor histocompatibility antigen H13